MVVLQHSSVGTSLLWQLDPFGGEFGEFWRCLSYLDPFHVYLDPFMFT